MQCRAESRTKIIQPNLKCSTTLLIYLRCLTEEMLILSSFNKTSRYLKRNIKYFHENFLKLCRRKGQRRIVKWNNIKKKTQLKFAKKNHWEGIQQTQINGSKTCRGKYKITQIQADARRWFETIDFPKHPPGKLNCWSASRKALTNALVQERDPFPTGCFHYKNSLLRQSKRRRANNIATGGKNK